MAARSGMTDLISRWRRMVDDAGTAVWSDDVAQQILDQNAVRLLHHAISPEPWYRPSNTVDYRLYHVGYRDMEGSASGTAYWYVYDADGNAAPTNTPDFSKGEILFAADTDGATYYVTAYSYDLDLAAAAAWRERAGMQADGYDFSADGASYSRSQWFAHCQRMADMYAARGGSTRTGKSAVIGIDRADTHRGW